ncbi:conserved membrane protein of unknown function [Magnetospirillum sp. XM-1]|nr:conserved membrane protein of unknown function [Magnetospirillum sp. XM-1]
MQCPFCIEEISDHALSCGKCGKDISAMVFRDMREQLGDARERIEALETAIQKLGLHVEHLDGRAKHVHHPMLDGRNLVSALAWIALPIALLMIAHWTLISVLDLNTWVLRLVSILIPLPFGFRRLESVSATLWAALLISILSVAGMLVSTSLMDHVPILPQGASEWTETLQYVSSIGLSYIVGNLIAWWWQARKSRSSVSKGLTGEIAAVLARSLASGNEKPAKMHERIATIAGWINAVMVILTTGAAVLTALGRFWLHS